MEPDLFSPPKLAAALLALMAAIAVTGATWVYRSHRALPPPPGPSPVAMAFAEIDRATRPKIVTVIPLKKTASAELLLDGTSSPPPKPRAKTKDVKDEEPERDVCARHGGRRIEFVRHHRPTWRCEFRHRGARY